MAFRVDPGSPAGQGLAAPVEGEGEDLFTGVDPESMFGYGENSFQYAENPFYDAETLFQHAHNTLNEEVEQISVSISFFLQPPQKSPNTTSPSRIYTQSATTNNLDMANFEDDSKLHLLADVALGTYLQEGQQQADATTPQNSSRDGEQLAQATAPEVPSHDDEQEEQVPANQGLTAVNATAPPRESTLNDPHPLSNSLSAAARPRQQVTTGRSRNGTTGFNRQTGQGALTNACGIVTPSKGTIAAARGARQGRFRCPRCNGRFTRPRSVKDHFAKCVEKYGNPNGCRWFDHHTLAKSREWLQNQAPAIMDESGEEEEGEGQQEEEGEGEEEGEEGEQEGEGDGEEEDEMQGEEGDEAGDDDEGHEQREGESSAAPGTESEVAAGERNQQQGVQVREGGQRRHGHAVFSA